MKRVVVTGATSMLGIAAIKECIRNNVEVLAISRAESRRREALPQSELITFVECDLSELEMLDAREKQYDVFYHFGWGHTDKMTREDPLLQLKNVEYTLDAVKLAHKLGCKKFVGAGSQAEYGYREGIITEETPCNPVVAYGVCKYAAGKLAAELCEAYGLVCIWTRTFSVYGTNDSPNTMVSYAVRQFGKRETAEFSAGTQHWDYLYEKDAGVYFYRLGLAETGSCVVNIASGNHRRLREYIVEIASVLGEGFKYHLAETIEEKVVSIQPDVTRLRGLTGYLPEVEFGEGVKRLAADPGGYWYS